MQQNRTIAGREADHTSGGHNDGDDNNNDDDDDDGDDDGDGNDDEPFPMEPKLQGLL